MTTFHERKKERTKHYEENVKGWKLRPCSACNGSGYYDHNDSPKCGACEGSGKERYNPIKYETEMIAWILKHEKNPESWTMIWWHEYKETKRGKMLLTSEDGAKIERIYESFKNSRRKMKKSSY